MRAIQNDPYDSGNCDISTTRLISPPQIVALRERHEEEIEEDASERIWSVVGQSIHVLLERNSPKEMIAEKRYFADVEGWKVSGAIDLLDSQTIIDYKVTSVYTLIYKSRLKEWEEQGNVNRWLYYKNGGEANKLTNVLLLRDWTMSQAKKNEKYPACQIASVDLPVWPLKEAEEFIKSRVKLHQKARTLADVSLPYCSEEERWDNKRCQSYCPVMPFCHQARRLGISKN